MLTENKAKGNESTLAFLAGFSGWTFDAFDFFILTYVVSQIATDFHQSVENIAFTIAASLLTRPLGAFLFGIMGDRWGRRVPLMIVIIFYSLVEVCSGLAHDYKTFLILRLLYGIGMGGAWGLSASLAMESVSVKWRGLLSGLLQQGYAVGNLLAAIAFWTVFPRFGWRPMFFLGVAPALLTLALLLFVKESEAWKAEAATQKSWAEYFRLMGTHKSRFFYLVLLMALMNFVSHGTQDLFPTFLQKQHHFDPSIVARISVISMSAALFGGVLIGYLSDRFGRRLAMIAAFCFGILIIPLWVLSHTVALITVGAVLMQVMVQGAWGVIPAHINELSPGLLRGFFPGFAYQCGVLIAASAPYIEALMTHRFTYGQSMGIFAACVLALASLVIGFGPEARGISFTPPASSVSS